MGFESVEGQGSKFWIDLPLIVESADAAPEPRFYRYLTKPMQADELLKVIEDILAQRR